MLKKQEKKQRRHKRIRAKIQGTKDVPRLGVFRSGRHIYAQLIDDEKGKTLASASDKELGKAAKTKKKEGLSGKKEAAFKVGQLIAEKGKKIKVARVVFDRSGYKYHGRVKALADGAREAGFKF